MTFRSLLSASAFAALAFASAAKATVLDFEGLTVEAAENLNVAALNYGGFTWSPSFALYTDLAFPTPVHSGAYGIVNNDSTEPLSVASNVAFDFNGAWINSWSFNAPTIMSISGFDAANNLIGSVSQMMTEGVETYVDASLMGVSRLEFAFAGGQFFTIDDFTFNETPTSVPEPSALVLFGLGLLALGLARRKSV